jgi:signal peptidase
VHRLQSLHQKAAPGGSVPQVEMLTKGDNNNIHDRGLYKGLPWISRKHIMGRACGFFPYVGMATIWMNDYPPLKYFLIGTLALFVLINRE